MDCGGSDLEVRLLWLEGVCVVREYLVLRAVLRVVSALRERLPPERAISELEGLLIGALRGAEFRLDRYSVYTSEAAAQLVLDLDTLLEHLEKNNGQNKAVGKGKMAAVASRRG